jgi:hypothetical protein
MQCDTSSKSDEVSMAESPDSGHLSCIDINFPLPWSKSSHALSILSIIKVSLVVEKKKEKNDIYRTVSSA